MRAFVAAMGSNGWKTVNNFRGGLVMFDPSVCRLRLWLQVGGGIVIE